ncbi:MAG TPA: hypothetical protein VEB63_09900 [Chitinophagaceae bacterium]|nr:hypothetical protein [Chitinophagaceae bacterium]
MKTVRKGKEKPASGRDEKELLRSAPNGEHVYILAKSRFIFCY